MAKEYNIKDLANHVRGVYSDSFINQQLVNLLECIGEVERTRGNEPTFPDYESVIKHYSGLLGDYAEKTGRLLMGTLEIKALASEIFGNPSAEIADDGKESVDGKSSGKRISLLEEFREGLAKRGLQGKELERRATSCAVYHRKNSRIAQYLRSEGKKLFAIDYNAFQKGVDEIITDVLKRKKRK